VYPIRPVMRHRQTVIMSDGQRVGGTRSFLPAVEGMRACAAMGVVVTHVAFQTGHSSGAAGRLFGRFDLAVAVFFTLSGFLLWRGHTAAARELGPRPPTGHYLRSAGGPHHAGLCGRRRGDPVAAARRGSRQPDRVAGET